MALTLTPEDCTVFVQIWVDINALSVGQVKGCYAVDNLQGSGEGTTSLKTVVPTNTSICWQVLPIDPQYAGTLSITQISAPNGWQSQPAAYLPTSSSVGDIWTGTVSASSTGGSISQGVTINFSSGSTSWTGQLPITVAFK